MPIDIKGNKRDASIYWQKIIDYSVKLSEISKIKLCEKSTKCAIFLAKKPYIEKIPNLAIRGLL